MKKITIAVNSEDIDYLSSINVYNIKFDRTTLLKALGETCRHKYAKQRIKETKGLSSMACPECGKTLFGNLK